MSVLEKKDKGKDVWTIKKTIALILVLLLTLSTFSALAAGKTIAINKKNFPDKNFRALVDGVDYDSNEDGKLTPAEIKKIDWVEATSCEIKDLTGIQYFPYLKGITAGDNSLSKIMASKKMKGRDLFI